MSLAWEVHLPDSDKLVLLALADWSNDHGECWPSIAKLAAKSSKSERTVQASIKRLCGAGHVERIETPGKGCRYIVHPRNGCTPAAAAPVQSSRPAAAAPPQPLRDTPAAAAPNTSEIHQSSTEASPPPKTRARSPDAFPKPEWADADHWRDFLANRAKKRLPNTATAHAKLIRDVERFTDADWPPGRILQHAAERGWAGIYDPRENRNGQRPHHNGPAERPRNSLVAAAADYLARGPAGERSAVGG